MTAHTPVTQKVACHLKVHPLFPNLWYKFFRLTKPSVFVPSTQDWATDLALFRSGTVTNPNNVKMHNNYAMELKERGRFDEARIHYLVSRQNGPTVAKLEPLTRAASLSELVMLFADWVENSSKI